MVSALILMELREKSRISEADKLIKSYLDKLIAETNLIPGGLMNSAMQMKNGERMCVPVAR
jgi:hypothetical protein